MAVETPSNRNNCVLNLRRHWPIALLWFAALSSLAAFKSHRHKHYRPSPFSTTLDTPPEAVIGSSTTVSTRTRTTTRTGSSSVLTMTATPVAKNHDTDKKRTSIQVGFIGNSILYYNDCPRLVEHMLQQRFASVTQNSCLRGGASLASLLEKGNGMKNKFKTPPALREDGSYDIGASTVHDLLLVNNTHPIEESSTKNETTTTTATTASSASASASTTTPAPWDFLIMNDHTQSPARKDTRTKAIQALQEHYTSMINTEHTTVIFLQTAAYRRPVKDSDDLGSFDEFTKTLQNGYAEYAKLFPHAKVAPVGLAYQRVKHQQLQPANPHLNSSITNTDTTLWDRLYARDDFHPSPHGTLLEASVLYCTMLNEPPPKYDVSWWETARYMQPPDEAEPLPLPTMDEAKVLQEVACAVCGVELQSGKEEKSTKDHEEHNPCRL